MYTFLLRLDELAEISKFIGDVITYERKKTYRNDVILVI